MKTIITTSITSLLIAAAALVATPAHADDGKIYPAEMCAPNTDYTDVTHYWGRLKNNTGSPINLECPVVRDFSSNSIVSGDVWVINQNYNATLSCTLGMLLPLSGGVNSVSGYFSTRSTTTVSSAPQKLSSFGGLGHLVDGYVSMVCSVPGLYNGHASGVVSYSVVENT